MPLAGPINHLLIRTTGFEFSSRRYGRGPRASRIGLWKKTFASARKPRRLVLVPGFGDAPSTWLATLAMLLPELRSRYDELLLLDFPGYSGALASEPCFASMDGLLEAFDRLLAELRPRTLMGHSMGGWLCASHVARDPGHLPNELILVAAAGVCGNRRLQDLWQKRLGNGGFAFGLEGFSELIFEKRPLLFSLFAGQIRSFVTREDAIALSKSIREEHLLDRLLPRIRIPVHLIWGSSDALVPPSCLPTWLEGLSSTPTPPGMTLLRGLGHGPHIEAPRELSDALRPLLRPLPPA